MKKINLDSTMEKLENISNKADVIMRNKLIIAIFLIVNGITFIFNPSASVNEMARNIIIIALVASFSTLTNGICSKTKDIKSIIASAVITVIAVILYIYPDIISAYLLIIFALFIIYDGAMNILNALNMSKLSKYTQGIAEKLGNMVNRQNLDKDLYEGVEQQKERFMNPLKNVVGKSNKSSILFIVTNAASIILGILLLMFSSISMIACGIIFIYTGISDLLIAFRTMNVSKKIKEKKFAEIFYAEDIKDEEEGEQNKPDIAEN